MVLLYQKQPWFAEYHYFCYMKFSRYTGAFYPNIIILSSGCHFGQNLEKFFVFRMCPNGNPEIALRKSVIIGAAADQNVPLQSAFLQVFGTLEENVVGLGIKDTESGLFQSLF